MMRILSARRGVAVLAVSLVAATVTVASTMARTPPAGPSVPVTIVTDSAGIPHITAKNFQGLGYGEGYAFAADNLCVLAEDVVTVNGERAKYFGPSGQTSEGVTNLDSDLFWRSVVESGRYARETSAPPPVGPLPQVRQIFQGYAAGYNAYLASGKLRDPACAGRSWVRPITMKDLYLHALEVATLTSSQRFITAEAAATPPPAGNGATPAPDATRTPRSAGASAGPKAAGGDPAQNGLAALSPLTRDDTTIGSNAIAVGRSDTRAGSGMVLANPHFPWQGTKRFWMEQLTVPGQYDMEGGTLMGLPFVAIGFNSSLSWTHTVATDQRSTFYQLKLVPGDPESYFLDGKPVRMGRRTITVDTTDGPVRRTLYTTRWGPLMAMPASGVNWTTTTAYALDDANLGVGWRFANQYLEMGKATSVQELLRVEERYLATTSFNTIAADSHGQALYADVGNVPGVSAALIRQCLPGGGATSLFKSSGLVTLDGSRSRCAWQTSPGTPVPGILNAAQEPHLIRTDYVENSNDSYWLANPAAPFPAYSPIIGDIDVKQNPRTQLGNEMIAARVAGTDGLGGPKFTVATMLAMWENDRSRVADLVLAPLVSDCRSTPSAVSTDGVRVDLTGACAALADYREYRDGDLDASGGWLFGQWYTQLRQRVPWTVPFDPAHPLTTPSGLDTTDPAVLRALADSVRILRAAHVPLTATYGQVQHATRGRQSIPIHGCATGCFNTINARSGPATVGTPAYGEVESGSSLVIASELTPSGPLAQGILTYSQATDPTSPWYADMTGRYSRKQWVTLPYTPAQLAARPGNQTLTLRP